LIILCPTSKGPLKTGGSAGRAENPESTIDFVSLKGRFPS
jgi:hypothetical protein